MTPAWHRSTHSGNGANCVEVAVGPNVVLARDSKDPGGPELAFPSVGWSAFVKAVRQ